MDGPSFTRSNEACRLTAYPDSLGLWTIGWGRHNGVTEGMSCTQQQANDWFDLIDYVQASKDGEDLAGALYWAQLNDVRQAAFVDMAFQLGKPRLSGFVKLIHALQSQAWETAYSETLNSRYAAQVPNRANKVANMFRTGQWPDQED